MSQEKKTEDRREFEFETDDGIVKYYLGMPTSEQIRKADWHYSKIYNKALVEGVATEAEMMDILKTRNIYGPDYIKELETLQVTIALKLNEMEKAEDELPKTALAMEVKELRNKLFQWNQRITGPLSNTCERMAEDARTEYLTSAVVQHEDGSLVWPTYDDFVNEPDSRLLVKSRFEVILWTQGLDADILKTPEDAVIRGFAEAKEARKEAKALQAAVQESEQKADEAVQVAEEALTKKKKPAKKAAV